MIKIEHRYAPDIIQQYEEKMLEKIKRHYQSEGLSNSIKIYFEENGCFSERKVRELLVGKITKEKIQSFPKINKSQRKKLGKFFSYRFLQNDQIRHDLIASLGIQVCPYCNRQYITSWCNGKKTKTTADIDHFYPKKTYPLLALSLYNFIPSCHICNSRMKLKHTDEIIYPYEECFGNDAIFKVVSDDSKTEKMDYVESLHSLMGLKNSKLDVKIEVNPSSSVAKKIKNSISIFRLEEVYQSHESYVRELLIKKRIYDEGAYLEMLSRQFNKYEIKFSDSELDLFMYGYNWINGEDPERPLSKLTYDVVKRG